MRIFLFILLVFCYHRSFSQDSIKIKELRWLAGVSGGIVYYNNIHSVNGFQHQYEYNKLSPLSSIDIGYKFSKRLNVSTGFSYFQINYKANFNWTAVNTNDPSMPSTTKIKPSIYDIPLTCTFNFIAKEKFSFYGSTGINFTFLASQEKTTLYIDNSTRTYEYINPFIQGAHFGTGVLIKGLKIEVQYRMFSKGFDSFMIQNPSAFCLKIGFIDKIQWRCFFKKGAWKPLPRCY
jgi:hypothetical protein